MSNEFKFCGGFGYASVERDTKTVFILLVAPCENMIVHLEDGDVSNLIQVLKDARARLTDLMYSELESEAEKCPNETT